MGGQICDFSRAFYPPAVDNPCFCHILGEKQGFEFKEIVILLNSPRTGARWGILCQPGAGVDPPNTLKNKKSALQNPAKNKKGVVCRGKSGANFTLR